MQTPNAKTVMSAARGNAAVAEVAANRKAPQGRCRRASSIVCLFENIRQLDRALMNCGYRK